MGAGVTRTALCGYGINTGLAPRRNAARRPQRSIRPVCTHGQPLCDTATHVHARPGAHAAAPPVLVRWCAVDAGARRCGVGTATTACLNQCNQPTTPRVRDAHDPRSPGLKQLISLFYCLGWPAPRCSAHTHTQCQRCRNHRRQCCHSPTNMQCRIHVYIGTVQCMCIIHKACTRSHDRTKTYVGTQGRPGMQARPWQGLG